MRAWLEVDLGVISNNYDRIRKHVGPGVGIIAVVKSDAYGHGIEAMTRLLDKKGVLAFAVISLEEAIQVRRFSGSPVLIMGYLDDDEIELAIASGFVLSLYDRKLADVYERTAAKLNRKAIVHLKVETGLNRLGMTIEEGEYLLSNPNEFPHLRIESIYSHLSSSSDYKENLGQLERFNVLVKKMAEQGREFPLHMANSYALPNFAEGYFNAVRCGLALYGVDEVIPDLQPSLEAKSVIIQRKTVRKGEGISYNKLYRAKKDIEIGVIGIGYAEGLTQALTGKAHVLVNGVRTPILGQICMNLSVIDLTGIEGNRGTEVTVIGKQQDQAIRVVDLAKAAGIRHHEILTRLGLALPRTYINDPFSIPERASMVQEIALV